MITTSYRPSEHTIKTAKQLSKELNMPFCGRNKQTVENLLKSAERDLLVVGKERFELYTKQGAKFFFHPNTAMFRAKRFIRGEQEPMLRAAGLSEGDTFLDCTLGLGSDAIIASLAVGETGSVIGIEKNSLVSVLVRTGLHSWETGIEELQAAMRRIQVKNGDCFEYIKQLPDNSVDVVYFDPMFHEPVETSDGIAPLRDLAEDSVLDRGCIKEAVRAARKSVVLKDHWKSPRFEQFGFNVMKRKTALFHYGVIQAASKTSP
ncbi:class I SAM-dependent methyltransferase [Bacillus spizizenii]|uniref:class I SAM-dependent methyltransferase n=1 Tax=Bacillus spizizenii TaxID=96241 RepID=UPI0005CB2BD2|nr:class I SAM-dependent methyltransferase [Bacillus spizizenii]MCY7972404.1 class I SAM-dependent methyltransferase [Bacillus spizizenii]MCY8714442.1 class I SAM-dependent methyltransferase [Bacillus spizizenii]MCY8761964.1 class I SAM-dependent methyltransferase [Bacillus spizizenii]MCY8781003.1 class I SAM-dependent methyltransferase [Bacillus spizizenii]MCY8785232.1 class I SAM-dependent methyltransferase [Bacillus spizizenii]